MKKTRDREILALSLLVKTLRPLDTEARKRAIEYALNRLKEEDYGNMSVREVTDEEVERMKKAVRDSTLLSPRETTEELLEKERARLRDEKDYTLLAPREKLAPAISIEMVKK